MFFLETLWEPVVAFAPIVSFVSAPLVLFYLSSSRFRRFLPFQRSLVIGLESFLLSLLAAWLNVPDGFDEQSPPILFLAFGVFALLGLLMVIFAFLQRRAMSAPLSQPSSP